MTNDLREGCQGTAWIRWHNDNVYIDEHDKQWKWATPVEEEE